MVRCPIRLLSNLLKKVLAKCFALRELAVIYVGSSNPLKIQIKDQVIVIDGSEVGCARAIMATNDIPLKNYVILTKQLDIKKNKNFKLTRDDIEKSKNAVKQSSGIINIKNDDCCCCG